MAAEAALDEAAARSVPVDVTFHGIGAFPGLERPRILWIGLAADGFPKEERARHPHLTIGRVFDERRWRREAGPPLRSALAQAASRRFGTLRVAEVALMRSDLSPSGARYTERRAVRLPDGVSNAGH